MPKKAIAFLILSVFLTALTGCATVTKQKDLEIQGLKNQISVLESRIQSQDEEISGLRGALVKVEEQEANLTKSVSRKKIVGEVKSRPKVKQIQIALEYAGYNPGRIDGRMGKQTREAIKAFQRANNLAVDGKVGKKTWSLLKEYLYKKIK